MVVGYIKEENIDSGIFQKIKGIEIRKFDNNYVIAISNKDKSWLKKRLVKYIDKLEIEALVFEKQLEGSFKEEICTMLGKRKLQIINGKLLMEYM